MFGYFRGLDLDDKIKERINAIFDNSEIRDQLDAKISDIIRCDQRFDRMIEEAIKKSVSWRIDYNVGEHLENNGVIKDIVTRINDVQLIKDK